MMITYEFTTKASCYVTLKISFIKISRPYSESKLELNSKNSRIRYSSLSFVRLSWGIEQRINLQLTGKISPKLDSNSSLILEYGCQLLHCFQ